MQRTHGLSCFFFPLLQNSNVAAPPTDGLVAGQQESVSSYLIFDGSKKNHLFNLLEEKRSLRLGVFLWPQH